MTHASIHPLLRFALRLDASLSLLISMPCLLWSDAIAALTRLNPELILAGGWFALVWATALGYLQRLPKVSSWLIYGVILGNLIWADGALWLAWGAETRPSLAGQAVLLVNAVATLTFAVLQWLGLRHSARMAVAA